VSIAGCSGQELASRAFGRRNGMAREHPWTPGILPVVSRRIYREKL
jgi:hypothetical protein